MAKKILVLGGSRFVGRAIVNLLTYYSYEVTVLNRGTEPILFTGVSRIAADRSDEQQMLEALRDQQFDVVIDVSGKNRCHVENVVKALELGTLSKYVFISSSAVYDFDLCKQPIKEEDVKGANFWGTYGSDMLAAENYLIEQFADTPVECVILRPPYIYGPYNHMQRESLIFHHLINDLPIYVPDDGTTKIQFYYVKDLANLVMTCINEACGNVAIYNVGNIKGVTFNEWIAVCEQVTGKKAMVRYVPSNSVSFGFFPFKNQEVVLDVQKVQPLFHKEIDFRLGLSESYEWFKENESLLLIDDDQLKAEQELAKQAA